ncbi:MAG: DUF4232 domain-containing protein [Polyangiaceae bacterium]
MRAISCFTAVALLGAAACGNEKTSTTPVGVSTASPVDVSLEAGPSAVSSAMPVVDAGASDPSAGGSEDPACTGTDIDLAAVLLTKKCRAGASAPATPASAAQDVKVTLTPSDTKVKPGGHLDLALDLTNSGSASIPLYFSGDLTLGISVKDAKGKIIAPPAGNAPKNADPSCIDKPCKNPESHLVLPPGGKAHAKIGWDAVKVAWPAKGPTTCCTIHVDAVAKGPLAAGTYTVKIPLPYESNQGNPADPEAQIRVGK